MCGRVIGVSLSEPLPYVIARADTRCQYVGERERVGGGRGREREGERERIHERVSTYTFLCTRMYTSVYKYKYLLLHQHTLAPVG